MGGGEHDIGDADQRHADQQVPDRHCTCHEGRRNAQDDQCPEHVRGDHQRSSAEPVHPGTDWNAQDKECAQAQGVDDSHFQGASIVASQVAATDGEIDKSRYRRYRIKSEREGFERNVNEYELSSVGAASRE